eukprot:2390411-Amphidinium_carterae.1
MAPQTTLIFGCVCHVGPQSRNDEKLLTSPEHKLGPAWASGKHVGNVCDNEIGVAMLSSFPLSLPDFWRPLARTPYCSLSCCTTSYALLGDAGPLPCLLFARSGMRVLGATMNGGFSAFCEWS